MVSPYGRPAPSTFCSPSHWPKLSAKYTCIPLALRSPLLATSTSRRPSLTAVARTGGLIVAGAGACAAGPLRTGVVQIFEQYEVTLARAGLLCLLACKGRQLTTRSAGACGLSAWPTEVDIKLVRVIGNHRRRRRPRQQRRRGPVEAQRRTTASRRGHHSRVDVGTKLVEGHVHHVVHRLHGGACRRCGTSQDDGARDQAPLARLFSLLGGIPDQRGC